MSKAISYFSQRIKAEGDNFSSISGAEQGVLLIFVASQAVRTLAHKRCVEEQVGGAVEANAFADVMRNMIGTMIDAWGRNFSKFSVLYFSALYR